MGSGERRVSAQLGALFPARQLVGLTVAQIRRCGQALRGGAWEIPALVEAWRAEVLDQAAWQPYEYEGYRPLAVDLTTFWRPRLQGWAGKFFHRIARRALKGIGVGLVVQGRKLAETRGYSRLRIDVGKRPRMTMPSKARVSPAPVSSVSSPTGSVSGSRMYIWTMIRA